jgi:hypothetical protein
LMCCRMMLSVNLPGCFFFFLDLGLRILKHLTVRVCFDCVIM